MLIFRKSETIGTILNSFTLPESFKLTSCKNKRKCQSPKQKILFTETQLPTHANRSLESCRENRSTEPFTTSQSKVTVSRKLISVQMLSSLKRLFLRPCAKASRSLALTHKKEGTNL